MAIGGQKRPFESDGADQHRTQKKRAIDVTKAKTVPCKFFSNPESCRFGPRCSFLHAGEPPREAQSRRSFPGGGYPSGPPSFSNGPMTATAIQQQLFPGPPPPSMAPYPYMPPPMYMQQPPPSVNSAPSAPRNFRTKPCKFFPTGACKLGDTCPYIHDSQQPQSQQSAPPPRSSGGGPSGKKTGPCKYFNGPGGCRNGVMCSFIHSDDKPRYMLPTVQPPYPSYGAPAPVQYGGAQPYGYAGEAPQPYYVEDPNASAMVGDPYGMQMHQQPMGGYTQPPHY
eukprot:gnl/Spiro4/5804_TR2960_c0_g1_i1.p1 gnl/Spiro4/5804_TR2960_c0_g1~~gnl/Spiro4/5804_TR2960_c0_g1_i1.p1  ORF type:complete len:304 (-),score=52.29 gnl/Spiro4/5804_TR2960_c0_g1_i1:174-1016(-)